MRRILAILAVLTVAGGVLRFEAAADPSAYQSKDEQSYAMIARGLSVTGRYGNPGMTDPVHWPPGAPLLFALAYELRPQQRGGGVWDVPSAYNLQALVGTLTIPAAFLLAFLIAGPWAGLVAAAGVAVYPPLISASGTCASIVSHRDHPGRAGHVRLGRRGRPGRADAVDRARAPGRHVERPPVRRRDRP